MVITREADYAIRLMVALAPRQPGTVVSARALASECDVPYELARTILGNLADVGILESRRGRSGGFTLARPAEEIRLGDVLSAAGETLQLNVCVNDPSMCGRSTVCPVHPIWTAASGVLRDFLATQTIAQILQMDGADATC